MLKQQGMHFVLCPKQGNKMDAWCCPKQGTVFPRIIAVPRLIAPLDYSLLPRPSSDLLFLLSPPCPEIQADSAKLIRDDSSSENVSRN